MQLLWQAANSTSSPMVRVTGLSSVSTRTCRCRIVWMQRASSGTSVLWL